MKSEVTHALIALGMIMSAGGAVGCAQVVDVGYMLTVPVYKATFVPKADIKINEYQERIDKLRPIYEAKVAAFREGIATHKKGVSESIDAGLLPEALYHLDSLYALTHPCRETECGSYPYIAVRSLESQGLPPLNTYEAYIEREGIDTEDAFIRDAVEKVFPLIGAYIEKRSFDAADVALEKYAATVAGPDSNGARYVAAHKNLKEAWVNVLVTDAEAVRGAFPGTAALLYAKASLLSSQRGEEAKATELLAQASDLRALVMNARAFEVGTGRISGPFSDDILSHVLRGDYDGEVRPVRGAGERATLSVGTRSPSYSRSTSSTTASFDYQDGTRTVDNPSYVRAQSDLESAERSLSNNTETCNTYTGSNPHSTCSSLDTDARRVELAEEALEGLAPTIEEPIIKQYSYPVTLIHLDTSMAVNASISLEEYRGSFSHSSSSARLTDREHGAYRQNDGSVGADPGIPPSERSGDSAVVARAKSDVDEIVIEALEGYRAGIAGENQGAGGDVEVHDLATVILLRPSTISDELRARLDRVSGITGATQLLAALK